MASILSQSKQKKACDMCCKKKIRCDGARPRCSQCISRKTDCIFTPTTKERVKVQRRGRRIVELETRLKEIEGRLAAEIPHQTAGTHASTAAPISPQSKGNPSTSQPLPPQPGSSPTVLISSRTEGNNETAIPFDHGSSGNPWRSDLPVGPTARLSSHPLPVYSQFLQQPQYISILGSMNDSVGVPPPLGVSWSLELSQNCQFTPFPPLPEMISLVQNYFTSFNSTFPIFHETSFLHRLFGNYASFLVEGSSDWASLSVILAISFRFRAMTVSDSTRDDGRAWAYLRNALTIINQLSLENNDLASVQTLLGIVVVLQGTPNPTPANVLIATVARLAQSICLHSREADLQFDELELHQRRRVFWLIYILDKDISLRTGRPSAINDDDMDLDLPDPDPADRIGSLVDGTCMVNVFSIRVRLAVIQSKVYARLYSAKALRGSGEAREQAVRELDAELVAWNNSLPSRFRPTQSIRTLSNNSILHIMILQLTYFNCLCMIHSMTCRLSHWLDDILISGLNESATDCLARCISAARSSIRLIKMTPQGNFASIWVIFHHLCISLIVLLGSVPQNAGSIRGKADLNLLMPLLILLNKLANDTQQPEQLNIAYFCNKLEQRARSALSMVES